MLQEKKEGGENSHIPPASLSAVRILIDYSSEKCLDASFVALSAFQGKHKIAARKEGKEKVQNPMRRGAKGKRQALRGCWYCATAGNADNPSTNNIQKFRPLIQKFYKL